MLDAVEKFRSSFSTGQGLVHLNNAGLCPTSGPAKDQVQYWVDRFHQEGMHCNDDYMQAAEYARSSLALFAGCDPGEIAFFQSTAGGISQVAFGMPLGEGDEVLMWDQEYASSLYPWKAACERTGAVLKLVPSGPALETPYERILEQVTVRTKVIALSWVQYQTGAVTDLKALARFAKDRGIWTVIDVIQGLGLLPFHFNELGIDAACGGSHKWMCSPVGVGYLIVRNERIPELRPLTVGSSTYGTCDDPASLDCRLKLDARRFESGSKQVLEITALGASAALLHLTGIKPLQNRIESLASRLRAGLADRGIRIHSPHGQRQIGSIVNFSFSSLAQQSSAEESLKKAQISYARRGPGLRLSPHAFNTEDEIDFAIATLAAFI